MQQQWRTGREQDKPRYPSDEHGQLIALKTDSQLADFRQIRRELKNDPYRPKYHFLRPDGRLNDPNGLCFWQGKWHLFYQAVDGSTANIHWGHAVSDDLLQWRDLPFAIYPGLEAACWSGSCWVEEHCVLAAYYGYTPERNCGVIIARSSDPLLLNWEKVNGGYPVIRETPKTHELHAKYRVFDPCLWKEGEIYYLLTGGYQMLPDKIHCAREEYLFQSQDLCNWEFLHSFLKDDRFGQTGDDGACPYFLPLGNKHLLLHYSHIGVPKYMIGEYDAEEKIFTPCSGGSFATGYYVMTAPSAAPCDGDAVVIFNMKEGRNNGRWEEIMTLPRLFRLGEHGTLSIGLAADPSILRGEQVTLEYVTMPVDKEILLPELQGNCMEIMMEADVSSLEVNVLRSADAKEFTRISFLHDMGAGKGMDSQGMPRDSAIVIDSSQSSMDPAVPARVPEIASLPVLKDEKLRLHIFIDKSVVEVFVNDIQCVSQRVYPSRADSIGVSVRAREKNGKILYLNCWQMKSIYED